MSSAVCARGGAGARLSTRSARPADAARAAPITGIGTSALITSTLRGALAVSGVAVAAPGRSPSGLDGLDGPRSAISAGLTWWFAPAATVIMFSPARSTVIIAIPVGTPVTARTPLSSIPSARRADRSVRPNSSSPVQPIIATDRPASPASLAAATA